MPYLEGVLARRGEAAFSAGETRRKALICSANQWVEREALNRGFASPRKHSFPATHYFSLFTSAQLSLRHNQLTTNN